MPQSKETLIKKYESTADTYQEKGNREWAYAKNDDGTRINAGRVEFKIAWYSCLSSSLQSISFCSSFGTIICGETGGHTSSMYPQLTFSSMIRFRCSNSSCFVILQIYKTKVR